MTTRADPVFASSTATVLGVVNARLNGNAADANLLIQSELAEQMAAGLTVSAAWANLFTAAVVALCDQLEEFAADVELTPQQMLALAAGRHAMESP